MIPMNATSHLVKVVLSLLSLAVAATHAQDFTFDVMRPYAFPDPFLTNVADGVTLGRNNYARNFNIQVVPGVSLAGVTIGSVVMTRTNVGTGAVISTQTDATAVCYESSFFIYYTTPVPSSTSFKFLVSCDIIHSSFELFFICCHVSFFTPAMTNSRTRYVAAATTGISLPVMIPFFQMVTTASPQLRIRTSMEPVRN